MEKKLSTNPYKGTRDFLPKDMKLRNWFFGEIRRVLALCAFDEYDGPMLEPLELYTAKSGEEIVSEQTYNFTDRGGRKLAVRPEMTPTVARMVAGNLYNLKMPLRWFSIPNLYRYERPQRGRLREHWQVNVDIFGSSGIESDLEIIHTAIQLMTVFGADETMFQVHINNRRFFSEVLASVCGLEPAEIARVSRIVDRKVKIPREQYLQELFNLGISHNQIEKLDSLFAMSVLNAVDICSDSQGAKELKALFLLLKELDLEKYCNFDFSIIRGLDYYTGTVFEVFDLAPENNRALFGGGRYDNLVDLFVQSADVPGVGFGFGDVTLENFLNTHNLTPSSLQDGRKILIIRFSDIPYSEYADLAAQLRDKGIPSSVYLDNAKIGKQLDYAAKEGYSHAILMGQDELDKQLVKVKNLETREEIACRRVSILENI